MKTAFIIVFCLICMVSCDSNTDTIEYTNEYTVSCVTPLTELVENVEKGSDGRSDFPEGIYVYTNQTAFDTFYYDLFSHKAFIPAAPTVDFGSYLVIAYVDIQHDTVDYSVEILEVVAGSGNNYTVTVQFTEPDGGAFQIVTKPFHIIKVPFL